MQPNPLDENAVLAFVEQLNAAPTPRLLDTWEANDRSTHSAEEFEAIRRILLERNVLLPLQKNTQRIAQPEPMAYTPPAAPKKKSAITWIIIAVVVLVLCCACAGGAYLLYTYGDQLGLSDLLGAGPTAQPTVSTVATVAAATLAPVGPTRVPEQAFTATPVVQSALPDDKYNQWTVYKLDDFNSNVNGWPEGAGDDNDYMVNNWEFTGGKLLWTVEAKDTNLYWNGWATEIDPVSNFYYSLDLAKEGATSNDLGLLFRKQDDSNFFQFVVNDSYGEYGIYVVDADNWETLVDWTTDTAIRVGQVNKLAVASEGDNLRFFINDQLVKELTDARFQTGSIGITIDTYDVGDQTVFSFDNLELRLKP